MLILKDANYLSPEGTLKKGNIAIQGARIASISDTCKTGADDKVVDIGGNRVIPGLIDIHTHGARGYDVSVSNTEDIIELSKIYARNGVTSFMPTTITDTYENTCKALKNIKAASACDSLGANIEGAHIEGPYISALHKGCHKESLLRAPAIEQAAGMKKILADPLKLRFTIAPELPGAMQFIDYVVKNGGYVSIGHCDANLETALEAVKRGANSFTHLFNAMRGINHREPGSAGAGLLSNAYVELICDGIHISPDIIKLVYKIKGAGGIIAITDSMPITGIKDGKCIFGGMDVSVEDGIARTADGTLAGSTLLLKDAVRNIVNFTGMTFEDAVRTATINPATAIGIDGVTGTIACGKRADLLVLDKNYEIETTYCRGKSVRI